MKILLSLAAVIGVLIAVGVVMSVGTCKSGSEGRSKVVLRAFDTDPCH